MIKFLKVLEHHLRLYGPVGIFSAIFLVLVDMFATGPLPKEGREAMHGMALVYIGFIVGLFILWLVVRYAIRKLELRYYSRRLRRQQQVNNTPPGYRRSNDIRSNYTGEGEFEPYGYLDSTDKE